MEPILFMKTACVLLAIAAVGGLVMAGVAFAGKAQPPTWLAMLHGLLAGAALTLLLFAYSTVGLPALAGVALLLFLLAAAGGAYLNLISTGRCCRCQRESSSVTRVPPWLDSSCCSWQRG